tara:strand:- start:1636 stop:2553 length:918 start_codon:yes stop_codon:yes gene_type:complete
MKVYVENVNLNSRSGPNHFAKKLSNYIDFFGCDMNYSSPNDADIQLSFIESYNSRIRKIPMVQRLDGIYFNAAFDCEKMNSNIKRTYEEADGVVFQTNFNKELIFKWFGEHDNYAIIRNGADNAYISSLDANSKEYEKYEKVWCCASSWHPFKRLRDNIEYFLQHSGANDCLVVAGSNIDFKLEHPRIFYVGDLSIEKLIKLFKASDYFIHLAYLDHCPNVVVDARASGCKIICSSSGGTKEIAGKDAVIIKEKDWDFSFLESPHPPEIDFSNKISNEFDTDLSMIKVAKKYYNFLKGVANNEKK